MMKPLISDIIIRFYQKKYTQATGVTINSFQPGAENRERPFDGGVLLNDIRYGSDYPNSFLDIFYSDGPKSKKPTLIYLHGGGFFMGGRSSGDPLTSPFSRGIAKQHMMFARQGINVVSMDYCLTPKYRFPDRILQIQDGLVWLREKAPSYRIDMDNVVLFGGSAGAVITAILGCCWSNPEYAKSIGVVPAFPLQSVKGLCIDGAPLNSQRFDWKLRTMFRSWMGNWNLSGKKASLLHISDFLTSRYPKTFVTAGNDGCFMEHTQELAEALRTAGAEVTEFYPDIRVSHEGHGYLGNWETSREAKRGMDAVIRFIVHSAGETGRQE